MPRCRVDCGYEKHQLLPSSALLYRLRSQFARSVKRLRTTESSTYRNTSGFSAHHPPVFRLRESQYQLRPERLIIEYEAGCFHPLDFIGEEGDDSWEQEMQNLSHCASPWCDQDHASARAQTLGNGLSLGYIHS